LDWRGAALVDINGLKRHWVEKHRWRPETAVADEVVDVFVHLCGKRLEGREYVLRLRYQPDWQTAGRREAFVDPTNHGRDGLEFWPPENTIRGINPNHRPQPLGSVVPCICLRGAWGYHSVLHSNERPDGTTLLGFLLELQGVIDE
jgi:hypothetical protein